MQLCKTKGCQKRKVKIGKIKYIIKSLSKHNFAQPLPKYEKQKYDMGSGKNERKSKSQSWTSNSNKQLA